MKEKKLKICFFSPSSYTFFSESKSINHGGAELQMYMLAKKIAENKDFEIIFFVGNYGQKKILYKNKIKLIRSFNLLNKDNIFNKLIKAIKLFFLFVNTKPDIVINTTANAIVCITGFYTKIFNKKYIYRTAHLIDVNTCRIKNNGISGKLYKYGLLNADKIITQNKEHKDLLFKNHSLHADVMRNCFEVNYLALPKKEYILWVGRFETWKNPELFLNLAKELKNNNFIMICPNDNENFKKWNIFKEKTNLLQNIEFIDYVPFFEIQDYFNRSKIFVNTSTFEGFPNTFLQAATARTPIVSLNVNPDNFITEHDCGIFCNNNFDLLIKKTKELLQNKEELEKKGENCYKYLKIKHDINKIGKQFEEIIYNIAKK